MFLSYPGAYMFDDKRDCSTSYLSRIRPKWYSSSSNEAGSIKKLAICVESGQVVQVIGPFPCRTLDDISIGNICLVHDIYPCGMIIPDRDYSTSKWIASNNWSLHVQNLRHRVHKGHESYNGWLKQFRHLGMPFKHFISKYSGVCFADLNPSHLSTLWFSPLLPLQWENLLDSL